MTTKEADAGAQTAEMMSRRDRLLGPAYRLFYDRPLHLTKGAGVWLYDADGTPYLDAYNNVASLGHAHPKVVAAIAEQASVLATHTRYLHGAVLTYAERLLATMPDEICQLMLTCSGSEANDLALRIAVAHTGNTGIIVTDWAYHGVTHAVAGFSPALGAAVAPAPHVRTIRLPFAAPGSASASGLEAATQFTAAVEAAIEDLAADGLRPAMLICDSLFSSDGVFDGPTGFLAGAVAAVRAAGGLYVADEVQSGFGRTGKAMWGFQRHGLVPDIVTMGKPMGNGYPVAGLAARQDVIASFAAKSRYFNTFGGNAVAVAAATAVLDVIEDEQLIQNAQQVGALLRQAIGEVILGRPGFGELRGAGLFFGLDLVDAKGQPDPIAANQIVNALRGEGVLISTSGRSSSVLKIRPPLIFSAKDVAVFRAAFEKVLDHPALER